MASASDEVPSAAAALIKRFNLQHHVEGGYFARTFESSGTIAASALPVGFHGERPHSTSILFLLTKGQVSHLHKIQSVEGWHHYAGDPLIVVECRHGVSGVGVCCTAVGHPLSNVHGLGTADCSAAHQDSDGQCESTASPCTPQHFVQPDAWFGAYLPCGSSWALVGCTVAPGFDFADFELADSAAMQSSTLSSLCGSENSASTAVATAGVEAVPRPDGMQHSSAWAETAHAARAIVSGILPSPASSD